MSIKEHLEIIGVPKCCTTSNLVNARSDSDQEVWNTNVGQLGQLLTSSGHTHTHTQMLLNVLVVLSLKKEREKIVNLIMITVNFTLVQWVKNKRKNGM